MKIFYSRYIRESETARQSVNRLRGVVTLTSLGPIEQFDSGTGLPVLVIHGVVGGSDHGLGIVRSYLGDGFRTIAVSRFGYGRSPLPKDGEPAPQADLYAALLDSLNIDRVAVLATSAGTSSSLQFVIRHRERCSALVLFSMAVPPYAIPPKPMLFAIHSILQSNFLWWFAGQYTPIIRRLMGIPRTLEGHISVEDEKFVADLMASFLPISLRARGLVHDMTVTNPDLNKIYPLESIGTPVMIFHSKDDPWGPFAGAKEIAARIPRAHFEAIESGGHLLLGYREGVRTMIADFIRTYSVSMEGTK